MSRGKCKATNAPKTTAARPHRPDDRRDRFVVEYLVDLNATQAAIRAGYSRKTADRIGSRLLGKVEVQRQIRKRHVACFERAELKADRVLEELRRVAFFDLGELVDENGHIRSIKDLSEEARSAVASIEVARQNLTGGDGSQEWVHKIRVWDKLRALELLAKYFQLLTERVRLDTSEELLALLDAGRQRNAERSRNRQAVPSDTLVN